MKYQRVKRRTLQIVRAEKARRGHGVSAGPNLRVGKDVTIGAAGDGRVVLGRDVEIGSGTGIFAGPGATVTIGDGVFISHGCTIAAVRSVTIGPESMVAELVSVRDHDHDPDFPPKSGRTLVHPVEIGARVWLASKCSVVRGGSVGDDSVVAAHALVNTDVPASVIAAGVPARVVRQKA